MTFKLPPLPYAQDALEPYISARTLNFHHGKHHQAYVNKLNALTENSELANASLEELIKTSDGGIFNNAAQVWNHTFYWNCMGPNAGGEPTGDLATAITEAFGSFALFKAAFTQAATSHFGSGWAWLVKASDGSLRILSTANAENPLRDGLTPLLTCDVWEHAYYLDTQNARPAYVDNFWQCVNWTFVAEQLAAS